MHANKTPIILYHISNKLIMLSFNIDYYNRITFPGLTNFENLQMSADTSKIAQGTCH